MNTKVKNDPSRYITRTSLASAVRVKPAQPDKAAVERAEQERRDAAGTIDSRWYIQLPPKR